MTEQAEEKSDGSFWEIFVVLLIFNIIYRVLGVWFIESVATSMAVFAVALIGYRFISDGRVGFLKWAIGSLLVSVSYMGFIYGASYLLCSRIGAAATWGLIVFTIFLSFRLVPEFFFKVSAKGEVWKWLAVSLGLGLLSAFFAYINPEGFCKG